MTRLCLIDFVVVVVVVVVVAVVVLRLAGCVGGLPVRSLWT